MNKLSEIIFRNFPYQPTQSQKKLFQMFEQLLECKKEQPTLVIKGYAGTGKTASIAQLVKYLPLFGYHSMLLAPTGRAAKVVSGYSSHSAYTIHKIIYKVLSDERTGTPIFSLLKNYHKKTIFIVDEASMIYENSGNGSSNLLSDLIRYVFEDETNKLILIGDEAQLPPVGLLFSPALDTSLLENRYLLNVMELCLKEVVRQDVQSGILENAFRIRESISDPGKPVRIKTKGFGDIQNISHFKLEEYLSDCYRDSGLKDTVILCHSNREATGFNRHIRNNLLFRDGEIEPGEILMVVKNNYYWLPEESKTGFLANGDLIEILKVRRIEEKYGFRFADLQVKLPDFPEEEPFDARIILNTLHTNQASLGMEDFRHLWQNLLEDKKESPLMISPELQMKDPYLNALQVKYTYAITGHKAQGGQWRSVFIKTPDYVKNIDLLEYKRWLYTAITRAIFNCFFIDFN